VYNGNDNNNNQMGGAKLIDSQTICNTLIGQKCIGLLLPLLLVLLRWSVALSAVVVAALHHANTVSFIVGLFVLLHIGGWCSIFCALLRTLKAFAYAFFSL
jgi:uncharacterized RDD family membrane protein YckC